MHAARFQGLFWALKADPRCAEGWRSRHLPHRSV